MSPIRAAGPADAEAIGGVYAACWQDAYPGLVPDKVLLAMTPTNQASNWSGMLRRDDGRGFVRVALDGAGRIVGFGSCGPSRTSNLAFDGEVFTLYMLPDSRGEGLGRALLRSLLARLREDGRRGAMVWVLVGNPARHFYAAAGGRVVAQKSEVMWGADLPQVAYAWPDLAAALAPSGPFAGP